MAKKRITTDTQVTVIAGEHRGQSGNVLSVDKENQRVTVEGINKQRKAMRRTTDNPQGGITEIEGPIHISNVMPTEEYEARRQRKTNSSQSDEQEEQD